MCFHQLITKKEYISKDISKYIKVAKRDIPVLKAGKRLGSSFISEYQQYEYKPNKIQPRIDVFISECVATRKEWCEDKWMQCENTAFIASIYEGYHSWHIKTILHPSYLNCSSWGNANSNKLSIAKFIIPKGTRYIYNKLERTYVSETIIFKEFICAK